MGDLSWKGKLSNRGENDGSFDQASGQHLPDAQITFRFCLELTGTFAKAARYERKLVAAHYGRNSTRKAPLRSPSSKPVAASSG